MVMSLLVITTSVPMFVFFAIQVYQLWTKDHRGTGSSGGSRRKRHFPDIGPSLLNLGHVVRMRVLLERC
jgi:hypothetical protein